MTAQQAELLAVLRSPDGAAALASAIGPAVADEIRRALAAREEAELLDTSALAKMLGCSARALRARIARGSALGSIARMIDGHRVWARRDVEGLIADRDRPRAVAASR